MAKKGKPPRGFGTHRTTTTTQKVPIFIRRIPLVSTELSPAKKRQQQPPTLSLFVVHRSELGTLYKMQ